MIVYYTSYLSELKYTAKIRIVLTEFNVELTRTEGMDLRRIIVVFKCQVLEGGWSHLSMQCALSPNSI